MLLLCRESSIFITAILVCCIFEHIYAVLEHAYAVLEHVNTVLEHAYAVLEYFYAVLWVLLTGIFSCKISDFLNSNSCFCCKIKVLINRKPLNFLNSILLFEN
jgi:hypothetical protein